MTKYDLRNYKLELTKREYHKKGSKWVLDSEEIKEVNEEFYNNVINSKSFMINLGGYERHIKSYTYLGYIVTSINSLSPNRDLKVTYDFNIIKR